MEIQALSSKATAVSASTPAANDDDTAATAFAALLTGFGPKLKADATVMDAKMLRTSDALNARTAEQREPAKVRDDNSDDQAPATAKAKPSKSRADKKDSDKDAKDAQDAQDDANTDKTAAADATQSQDQTAAPVVAVVPVDVPVITTAVEAPIVAVQQVEAPTAVAADATPVAAIAQPTAVDPNAAAATPSTIADQAAQAAAAATPVVETQKADIAQVAAAVAATPVVAATNIKTNAAPVIKQTDVQTAAPVQVETMDDTTIVAPVVAKTAGTEKTKDTTQVNTFTVRSAAAQQQSQDLSRQSGADTKAQVRVTVNGPQTTQQAPTTGVYDIYSGYTGSAQTSTANGQVGTADAGNALVQDAKTPVELAQAQTQAQAAATPAAAIAPQPQAQPAQPGATSSAIRADIATPAPSQSSGAGYQSPSYGDAGSYGPSAGAQATTQTTSTAAAAQSTPTDRPLATAQQVIDQIKVNITRAAKAGLDKVTIRLTPEELGRIDVKLEMSDDHKVKVTVTADNKDTLHLLQTDSRTLERTLNDAGLRTDANNLHFNLRSDSDAQQAGGEGRSDTRNASANDNGALDTDEAVAMTYDYTAAAQARGGVDTFA